MICLICFLQEIKGLREELSTRLNANDTMEIIREKEEQIRGLLEEGLTFCITSVNSMTTAFCIESVISTKIQLQLGFLHLLH